MNLEIIGTKNKGMGLMTLNEYLTAVKNLTGTKVKFANPVMRADYEDKSVKLGQWLTLTQYECSIGLI